MRGVRRATSLVLAVFLWVPGTARAQSPAAPPADPPTAEAPQGEPTTDIFDVWRTIRHGADVVTPVWDYHKLMIAFAPVVGAKPSAGLLLGVAGNVAFYRGEPSTTHISSVIASLTFSTKGQIAITERLTMFSRDDRWRFEGDHRLQWTSQDTHPLGTSSDVSPVVADYTFLRLYQTAFHRLRRSFFAGGGLYFDKHSSVEPADGEEADWAGSPYVEYTDAHGLPVETAISAGPSVDLLWDNRDSFINADRGWLARASYRLSSEGFLGADASWQRASLDVRSYAKLSAKGRDKLAFWFLGDLLVGGTAPYLDLPASGLDTYGRSARGYGEGRFRGEKLAYGEVEYRRTLMKNGLVGMVAFLNTTTTSNLAEGEHLFDSFATGGGAGLRLLINKRSKTNLCFDVGFGRQGSHGIYLAIQEAF